MKKLLSLICSIVIIINVATNSFAIGVQEVNIKQLENNTSIEHIFELKPFVIFNENGTLSLDVENATQSGKELEAMQALMQHFEIINPKILSAEISVDEELNITGGVYPIKSHRCSLGRNSYSTYWWGYERYACNHESNRIISDLNTLAAGSSMVGGVAGGIASIFPVSAPIAGAIAGGAAFDAGYWWLLATRIGANNNGRGTIIQMSHVLFFDIKSQ